MFKYNYKGDYEVEAPSKILSNPKDTKIVKAGESFDSSTEINHPHFELASGSQPKQEKEEKKEEVKQ